MIQGFFIMLSVNELALEIFDNLADLAEEFNCAYHELDNGARIVDCGVAVRGGYAAGRAFTEICMGGLGEVNFRMGHIRDFPMPFIDVNTDFPAISCLGAQKAGWTVKVGNFFAMGSGPARALSLKPKHTFEVIEYEDDYDVAVICLESDHLPNAEVMNKIAEDCHIDVANVCAVVAPTSSMVGSIQVPDAVSRPRSTSSTSSGLTRKRSSPPWELPPSRRSAGPSLPWVSPTMPPSTTAASTSR